VFASLLLYIAFLTMRRGGARAPSSDPEQAAEPRHAVAPRFIVQAVTGVAPSDFFRLATIDAQISKEPNSFFMVRLSILLILPDFMGQPRRGGMSIDIRL
jgi:hypothetical protein